MKFYCVRAEFYEDRYSKIKSIVTSHECNPKPRNQIRQVYGLTAFNIWFQSESQANELCENIKTGDVGIGTMIEIFNGLKELKVAA